MSFDVIRFIVKSYFLWLILMGSMAFAAPPSNDNFASRIVVNSAAYTITTSNVDATTQSGENTMDGELGATIWWQWTAPSSGWVNFTTRGSDIDTVMRVTSTASLNGTLFGFNDEEFDGSETSSLTFQVTAGQVLYVCLGGYVGFSDAEEGNVVFQISTGTAAQPEVWISSTNFTPATVNITSAARTSVFSTTMSGVLGKKGKMDIGTFSRTNGDTVDLRTVEGADFIVGTTAATRTIEVPRYMASGLLQPSIVIETEDGDIYQWGNARSGLPYLMTTPTLTIQNTGTTDTVAPVLSAFSISSRSVNVNSSAVTLQVSMTISDNLSEISQIYGYLYHPSLDLFREIIVTRTSGTATNGTWTGSVTVPKEYPTASYEVYIEIGDQLNNFSFYGDSGDSAIPGGNVSVNVNGGGSYWLWAYERLDDSEADLELDPNQDGIDNLTCFAFGIDPISTADPSDLPSIKVNDIGRLEIEYLRRVASTGLSYKGQFSNDMKAWSDFTGLEDEFSSSFPGWNTVIVEDNIPSVPNSARFARMKLTYVDP